MRGCCRFCILFLSAFQLFVISVWVANKSVTDTAFGDKHAILCTMVLDEPMEIISAWTRHHAELGFDIVLYNHGAASSVDVGRMPSNVQVVQWPDAKIACVHACEQLQTCKEWESGAKTEVHGFASCQVAAFSHCLSEYAPGYVWFGNLDVDEYVFLQQPGKHHAAADRKVSLAVESHANDTYASRRVAFWSQVEGMGNSVQLECLKFGPRRDESSTFGGDALHHTWRVPYRHLGDDDTPWERCKPNNDSPSLCENYGGPKVLSRIAILHTPLVHFHVLAFAPQMWYFLQFMGALVQGRGTAQKYQESSGIRCHHYAMRSREQTGLKAVKNKNEYLAAVARSSLLEADGWYNSVYDNTYPASVEFWRKTS